MAGEFSQPGLLNHRLNLGVPDKDAGIIQNYLRELRETPAAMRQVLDENQHWAGVPGTPFGISEAEAAKVGSLIFKLGSQAFTLVTDMYSTWRGDNISRKPQNTRNYGWVFPEIDRQSATELTVESADIRAPVGGVGAGMPIVSDYLISLADRVRQNRSDDPASEFGAQLVIPEDQMESWKQFAMRNNFPEITPTRSQLDLWLEDEWVTDPESIARLEDWENRPDFIDHLIEGDYLGALTGTSGEVLKERYSFSGEYGENLYAGVSSGELWRKGFSGRDYWRDVHGVLAPSLGIPVIRPSDHPVASIPRMAGEIWAGEAVTPPDLSQPGIPLIPSHWFVVDEGEPRKKWQLYPSELLEGWERGLSWNLMGIDVLNETVPISTAQAMAETYAEGSERRSHWESLTTNTGRHLHGLFLEILLDPTWMVGRAAKSSRFVDDAGTVWRFDAPMADATRTASGYRNVGERTVNQHAINLKVGDQTQQEEAISFFDETINMMEDASKASAERSETLYSTARQLREAADQGSELNLEAARGVLRSQIDAAKNDVVIIATFLKGQRGAAKKLAERFNEDVANIPSMAGRLFEKAQEDIRVLDGLIADLDNMGVDDLVGQLRRQGLRRAEESTRLTQGATKIRYSYDGLLASRPGSRLSSMTPAQQQASRDLSKAGFMEWHIPFSHRTRTLIPRWAWPRAALTRIGKVADILDPFDVKKLRQIDKVSPESLSFAERVRLMSAAASDLTFGNAATMATWVTELLARMFLTREHVPMLTKVQFSEELEFLEDSGRLVTLFNPNVGQWVRPKKIPEHLWQSHVEAQLNLLRSISVDNQKLMVWANRFDSMAERIATNRNASFPDHPVWGRKDYGKQHVIMDALQAIDEGWEELDVIANTRPDMVKLFDEMESLVVDLAPVVKKSVEEVRQSVAQISLYASGNKKVHDIALFQLDQAKSAIKAAESELAAAIATNRSFSALDKSQALANLTKRHDEVIEIAKKDLTKAERELEYITDAGNIEMEPHYTALLNQRKLVYEGLIDAKKEAVSALNARYAKGLSIKEAATPGLIKAQKALERAEARFDSLLEEVTVGVEKAVIKMDSTKAARFRKIAWGKNFDLAPPSTPFFDLTPLDEWVKPLTRTQKKKLKELTLKSASLRRSRLFLDRKKQEVASEFTGASQKQVEKLSKLSTKGLIKQADAAIEASRTQTSSAVSRYREILEKKNLTEKSLKGIVRDARPRFDEIRRGGSSKEMIEAAEESLRAANKVGNPKNIEKAEKYLRKIKAAGTLVRKEMDFLDHEVLIWESVLELMKPISYGGKEPYLIDAATGLPRFRDYEEYDVILAALSVMRHSPPAIGKIKKGRVPWHEEPKGSLGRSFFEKTGKLGPLPDEFLDVRDKVSKAAYDNMVDRYGKELLIGRRLGDVPADLVPLIKEMARTFKEYEKLLVEKGASWIPNKMERLKRWGGIGYTPHMLAKDGNQPWHKTLVGIGSPSQERGKQAIRQRLSANEILEMQMDARRPRTHRGTWAELAAISDDTALVHDFDIQAMIGRYLQANRSLANQDYIWQMMEHGVFKVYQTVGETPAYIQAAKDDYVPIIRTYSKDLDESMIHAILTGTPAQWRAMKLEQKHVDMFIAGATPGSKDQKSDVFNTMVRSAPGTKQYMDVQRALATIRGSEMSKGVEHLTDLKKMYDTARAADPSLSSKAAWDIVAKQSNRMLDSIDSNLRLRGPQLKKYFNEDGKSLVNVFAPRVVAESMREVLGSGIGARVTDAGWDLPGDALRWTSSGVEWFNNFWKTRLTILFIGFTGRNQISNTINNIIDTGVGGTFSISTNAVANLISATAPLVERYGSIDAALKFLRSERHLRNSPSYLQRPLGILESVKGVVSDIPKEIAGDLSHEALEGMINMTGTILGRDVLKDGIDVGDGIVRSLDDAIRQLTDEGIINPALTQFVEVDRAQQQLSMFAAVGKTDSRIRALHTKAWDAMKTSASIAEDAFWITVPSLVTGGVTLPISLGKGFGRAIARHSENHARMVNFTANLKRGGNWNSARQNVEKYRVTYDDLPGLQRTVMRHIVPFFVWRHKNFLLHAKMLVEQPQVYAAFHRFLIEGAPTMVDAMNADRANKPMDRRWTTADTMLTRRDYSLPWFKIPWPGSGRVGVQKLGTTMEAAMEDVGLLGDFLQSAKWHYQASGLTVWVRPESKTIAQLALSGEDHKTNMMRLASQITFPVKALLGRLMNRHFFYNVTIPELRNTQQVGPLIQAVGNLGRMIPGVGNSWEEMGKNIYDYHVVYDPVRNRAKAASTALYWTGSSPWSRGLADLAAATDLNATSLAANPELLAGTGLEDFAYSDFMRLFRVYTGIGLIADNPMLQAKYNDQEITDIYEEWLIENNVFDEFSGGRIAR